MESGRAPIPQREVDGIREDRQRAVERWIANDRGTASRPVVRLEDRADAADVPHERVLDDHRDVVEHEAVRERVCVGEDGEREENDERKARRRQAGRSDHPPQPIALPWRGGIAARRVHRATSFLRSRHNPMLEGSGSVRQRRPRRAS